MKTFGLFCLMLVGCHHQLEKDFFFEHSPADRVERMRQYPLEDQYRIFRYGNDKIEPPLMELANPIADKGAAAVPFLMNKLEFSKDDLAVRDILLVLETMVRFKTYDVKNDASLMKALSKRISQMRTEYWRSSCQKDLERLKGLD